MDETLFAPRCEQCGETILIVEFEFLAENVRYEEGDVFIQHKICNHPQDVVIESYGELNLVVCSHDI